MKLALHIFKKDVAYLRAEISLVLLMCILLVLVHLSFLGRGVLPPGAPLVGWILVSVFLIVKLIHAEAIPGDRQFWLTRPYSWSNLLIAKLLFIVLFVNVPMMLARLAILIANGFSLSSALPGLVWWQFLLMIGVELPIVALAALTESAGAFIVSLLFVWAVVAATLLLMDRILSKPWTAMPPSLQWTRNGVMTLVVSLGAALVLYLLYNGRRTSLGRGVATGFVAATVLLPQLVSAAAAGDFQALISSKRGDFSEIRASFEIVRSTDDQSGRYPFKHQVVVTGIPDGMRAHVDWWQYRFEDDGGHAWGPIRNMQVDTEQFDLRTLRLDGLSVEGKTPREVALAKGTVYLTLFGDPEPVSLGPSNVLPGGVQCIDVRQGVDYLYCRTPFQGPRGLLLKGKQSLWPAFSPYAIPAAWNWEPFTGVGVLFDRRGPAGGDFTLLKQIGHVRVDFQTRDVRTPQ